MSAFGVRMHMRRKKQSDVASQLTDRGSILALCAALILAAAMVLIVIIGTGQTDWATESRQASIFRLNTECC